MVPTLFHVGSWGVPAHEFFIGLGVVAAVFVYFHRARDTGAFNEQIVWVAIGALVTGGIFAHISSAWRFAFTGDNSLVELWLHGGRSVLGGLAGAYLGAVVTKRIVGYRRSTGDLFAPAVAIGMAIGRIGCLLTEQIGTVTSLPWGVSMDPALAATIPNCPQCASGQPMHPSFAYEIVFHLVAFVALWRLRDRLPVEGESFKLYLLGYGLFRFAVEFVRGNPAMAFGLSGSQLFLLATLPLLLVHVWRSRQRGAYVLLPRVAT